MDFILFYFFLQFVEELLKWLAGPPITSGDMPRQALPSSSWQVRYYIWWMCGNYTSTMRSSPYSAFSTLPPHPSVTLMGDKFNLTFCLSSYHIKYNENKTENKDRSKIKDKRAGRKKRQINGKTGWQWVCVSQRLISWSGITISVCVCADVCVFVRDTERERDLATLYLTVVPLSPVPVHQEVMSLCG